MPSGPIAAIVKVYAARAQQLTVRPDIARDIARTALPRDLVALSSTSLTAPNLPTTP